MNLSFTHASCILLSAGNSERMGIHKALLKFDENTTFIQQIAGTYERLGVEQIIVVVSADLFGALKQRNLRLPDAVTMVVNDRPELGRFYSLQTGLQHLRPGNCCFLHNIDNPTTTAELLRLLIIQKLNADVIVPEFQRKSGHPVLLNHMVAFKIQNTEDVDIRIDAFLKKYKTRKVETSDHRVLININSPEEYRAAGFPFEIT
jgi:CTP:molybdopterin cytidylyltransferase MocA